MIEAAALIKGIVSITNRDAVKPLATAQQNLRDYLQPLLRHRARPTRQQPRHLRFIDQLQDDLARLVSSS